MPPPPSAATSVSVKREVQGNNAPRRDSPGCRPGVARRAVQSSQNRTGGIPLGSRPLSPTSSRPRISRTLKVPLRAALIPPAEYALLPNTGHCLNAYLCTSYNMIMPRPGRIAAPLRYLHSPVSGFQPQGSSPGFLGGRVPGCEGVENRQLRRAMVRSECESFPSSGENAPFSDSPVQPSRDPLIAAVLLQSPRTVAVFITASVVVECALTAPGGADVSETIRV
jgi:hypothetical protein